MKRLDRSQIKKGMRLYGAACPGHHVSPVEYTKGDPISDEVRDAGIGEILRRLQALRQQLDDHTSTIRKRRR